MKLFRRTSVFLVVSLTLLMLVIPASAETDQVSELRPIHEQDFETTPVNELPEGWQLIEVPGSIDYPHVIDVPDAVDGTGRVLYTGRTSDTPNTTSLAAYSFDPVHKRLQIAFNMWQTTPQRSLRVTLGGGDRSVAEIHSSPKAAAIFLMMNNGTILVLKDADANEWIEAGKFKAEQWHRIVLDIDIEAQTFNLHLDNAVQPENAEPIPFYADSEDLRTLAFGYQQSWVGANNTAPAYVDDVLIWGM